MLVQPVDGVGGHWVHRTEPAVADLVAGIESHDKVTHLAVDAVVEDVFGNTLLVEGFVDPDNSLEKGTSGRLGGGRSVP